MVDGAPVSSNPVALVSVLANDVIETSQGMESSSASMAVLPSGFLLLCLLWQSIDASPEWGPKGFCPSWGWSNPLPHPADGLEWSTTVDRWACQEAYWDSGKGSVSLPSP